MKELSSSMKVVMWSKNSSGGSLREETTKTDRKVTYMFIIVGVMMAAILFYIFIPMTVVNVEIDKECGDGFCNENCFSCPLDCECKQGVCYNEQGKCGKIPTDITNLLTQRLGQYSVTESWADDDGRTFKAVTDNKEYLIKNGDIIELGSL